MRASTSKVAIDRARTVRFARYSVLFLFAIIIIINLSAIAIGNTLLPWTHSAAVGFASYLMAESLLFLRRSNTFSLASPAFLAIPTHFVLSYLAGITASAFYPDVMMRFADAIPDVDAILSNSIAIAALAAFSMLRGYAVGKPKARQLRAWMQRLPSLRRDLRMNWTFIILTQAVYIALAAYAIQIGVFGLLSTPESLERQAGMLEVLNIGLGAGTLSYFLILLGYFERRTQKRAALVESVAIAALIAVQVLLGILSAFKSQVFFPFLIAGLAYFIVFRKFPIRFALMAIVALTAAYAIVEPFRTYLGQQGQRPGSVAEAFDALGASLQQHNRSLRPQQSSLIAEVAERLDLLGMSALAIDYTDRGELPSSIRDDLRDSILFAPILAYAPRALWADKPSYSRIGMWFNQTVRGQQFDEQTSVAMGPVGYLYMTGGIGVVILGFAGLGIAQAIIFEGTARAGAGGLIVYLSVASTLVLIPSAVGPAITGLLRLLPIAFLAQWLLLRPTIARKMRESMPPPRSYS